MSRGEIFRKRLRLLRNERGVTQQQVADGLGITETGYVNYEAGRRKPNFDVLPAIADFFGVSTDYLFGRSDVPQVAGKGAFDNGIS